MPNINDGLGNELTEHEIREVVEATDAAETEPDPPKGISPVKAAYDAAKKLHDEQTTAEKLAEFGAFVQPGLTNKGGGHGAVMGSTSGWLETQFLEPDPLTELPPADVSPAQTRYYLGEMQTKLDEQRWVKHPNIIDRWVGPNGVGVEMGYTHGEAWFRALEAQAFQSGDGARTPLWTQRVHGYNERSRETFEGIFRDLMELARSERHERLARVSEGRPGPLTLGFALLTPDAKLPTKTYNDDAGFDLYVAETTNVGPGEFVDVPLGVSVGLPPGVWARITGRSSTLRRLGLLVNEGIIDTGYTGPLFAGVFNVGVYPVQVMKGDRIAQIILHENTTGRFSAVAVDGHAETTRGVNGFGSSGN